MIVDHQHLVDNLEISDLSQLDDKGKRHILNPNLQSAYKNLGSKVYELAQTTRPDIMFATKYLTTKYRKATKSDMMQVIKLIKRIKDNPSNIVIPSLGMPEN